MHLRDITMADLPLYRELLTDPTTMAELGGPLPEAGLEDKLRSIVDEVARGEVWYSVIVPGDGEEPVGSVCIWEHDDEGTGESIGEIGWMVLPPHQGRGLASAAVRLIVERARSERRWGPINAFPGVTNGASNAICRKSGFRLLGERPIVYASRTLPCNHWVLEPDCRRRLALGARDAGPGGCRSWVAPSHREDPRHRSRIPAQRAHRR